MARPGMLLCCCAAALLAAWWGTANASLSSPPTGAPLEDEAENQENILSQVRRRLREQQAVGAWKGESDPRGDFPAAHQERWEVDCRSSKGLRHSALEAHRFIPHPGFSHGTKKNKTKTPNPPLEMPLNMCKKSFTTNKVVYICNCGREIYPGMVLPINVDCMEGEVYAVEGNLTQHRVWHRELGDPS